MFDVNAFAPPALVLERRLAELVAELKSYGIEGVLLSPLDPADPSSSWTLNKALISATEDLSGCCTALAFEEGIQKSTISGDVKALRVYPPTTSLQLEHAAELCERLGLPLIISLRVAWGNPSIAISDLQPIITGYSKLKLILSGVNYTETRWLVSEVAELPNVYVEISMYQQMEGVSLLARRLGVERLLFGTAYPLQNPYVSILKLLFSGLSEAEIDRIAYKNALALFGIE